MSVIFEMTYFSGHIRFNNVRLIPSEFIRSKRDSVQKVREAQSQNKHLGPFGIKRRGEARQ